jgi:hypothetical protein
VHDVAAAREALEVVREMRAEYGLTPGD